MADFQVNNFRDFIGSFKKGDLGSVQKFYHSGFFSIIAISALAALTTLILTLSLQRMPANLKEGMIAPRNIKADRNYEIVDEEATQKFKDEAALGILPVYDFDDRVMDSIAKRVHEAFSSARGRLDALVPLDTGKRLKRAAVSAEVNQEIETVFTEKLGIVPTPTQWRVLMSERFSVRMESWIVNLLRKVMQRPVVAERGSLDAEKGRGISLRRLKGDGAAERYEEKILEDVGSVLSTEEARKKISAQAIPAPGLKNAESPATILAIAELLVEPNCALNRTETENRKQEAALGVKNVILKVNTGEMIIREGARYEPWHIKVLEGIRKDKRRGMYSVEFAGTFIIVLFFLIMPFYLAARFFRRGRVTRSDYFFMAFIGLSVLCLMRLSLMLAPAVHDALFFNVSVSSLNYLIPVAGGVMLLKMFLGAEIALVFSVVLGIVTGFFIEANVNFVAFCLISNFTAIISIANADRRSLIIRAGVITGIVGAAMLFGVRLVGMSTGAESITASNILWSMFFAFLGGIGSSIFTMIAAPIVESVSGYTSDIKLLELANLNHPLLRELIVRAPGTYHHSHMVGILGEAAAEAIGAKALLVRVGAYYHDIGKMKKPQYFIENAKAGENKHERLSPHMSALIVAAHVKDGVEMALKSSLPRVIADMIPQHHGTRLIGYFYDRAKEKEDEKVERVDSKDFIYPGPKPQTREAAILMLADATEAAVRSLKEKSTTRVQQTVQRVITDIFMEKQLDECELTLRDLNEIARAFVRILLGIYHSRIEYPKDTENDKLEVSIVEEGATNLDNAPKPASQS